MGNGRYKIPLPVERVQLSGVCDLALFLSSLSEQQQHQPAKAACVFQQPDHANERKFETSASESSRKVQDMQRIDLVLPILKYSLSGARILLYCFLQLDCIHLYMLQVKVTIQASNTSKILNKTNKVQLQVINGYPIDQLAIFYFQMLFPKFSFKVTSTVPLVTTLHFLVFDTCNVH